jgi:DNA-directed RNA polymerase subunit K/omega
MTQQQHPITPPPELVEQWMQVHTTKYDLARQAAQWGADQELEACCELTRDNDGYDAALALRAERRPKPPSLKELALAALNEIEDRHAGPTIQEELIRRALEQLDD